MTGIANTYALSNIDRRALRLPSRLPLKLNGANWSAEQKKPPKRSEREPRRRRNENDVQITRCRHAHPPHTADIFVKRLLLAECLARTVCVHVIARNQHVNYHNLALRRAMNENARVIKYARSDKL